MRWWWHRARQTALEARRLSDELLGSTGRDRLVHNPLLLTMLLRARLNDRTAPGSARELYEVIYGLLVRRHRGATAIDAVSSGPTREAVETLALDMMEKATLQFEAGDASKPIKDLLSFPDKTGAGEPIRPSETLFVRRAATFFEFRERSLQEYLAAKRMLKSRSVEDALRVCGANMSWWGNTLRFYLEDANASVVLSKCQALGSDAVSLLGGLLGSLWEAARLDRRIMGELGSALAYACRQASRERSVELLRQLLFLRLGRAAQVEESGRHAYRQVVLTVADYTLFMEDVRKGRWLGQSPQESRSLFPEGRADEPLRIADGVAFQSAEALCEWLNGMNAGVQCRLAAWAELSESLGAPERDSAVEVSGIAHDRDRARIWCSDGRLYLGPAIRRGVESELSRVSSDGGVVDPEAIRGARCWDIGILELKFFESFDPTVLSVEEGDVASGALLAHEIGHCGEISPGIQPEEQIDEIYLVFDSVKRMCLSATVERQVRCAQEFALLSCDLQMAIPNSRFVDALSLLMPAQTDLLPFYANLREDLLRFKNRVSSLEELLTDPQGSPGASREPGVGRAREAASAMLQCLRAVLGKMQTEKPIGIESALVLATEYAYAAMLWLVGGLRCGVNQEDSLARLEKLTEGMVSSFVRSQWSLRSLSAVVNVPGLLAGALLCLLHAKGVSSRGQLLDLLRATLMSLERQRHSEKAGAVLLDALATTEAFRLEEIGRLERTGAVVLDIQPSASTSR